MSGELLIKGLGMLPAVAAFKADREAIGALADPSLRPYLDEEVDLQGWYPVEHIIGILRLVAGVHFADSSLWEAFDFFGTVSAKRDLEGVQDTIYRRHRAENTGWYRGAVSETHTPAEALRRAFGLHQLYYDKGEFQLRRVSERRVEAVLLGMPRPHEELCALANGYATEVCRYFKVPAVIGLAGCEARGDARCVWHLDFHADADVSSLDSLPS